MPEARPASTVPMKESPQPVVSTAFTRTGAMRWIGVAEVESNTTEPSPPSVTIACSKPNPRIASSA